MIALLAVATGIKRRICGVKGRVIDGGVLPAAGNPTEELKDQLRANILARYGCVHQPEVPAMEPIEIILPPNLNVAEMAQKRNEVKGVTTIGAHHRAVIKEPALEIVKGVDVQVIPDDHPIDQTPVAAEIIIATGLTQEAREFLGDELSDALEAPIDLEVQEFEKADLRFWDNFFSRIAQKSHILDMVDDAGVLACKDKITKGYHPIKEMGCEVYGIVHVTKNSVNALWLVDREAGTFRTVTATKRFSEETEVGVLEAKAFLNGRY